jgi:hypothetical protein
MTAAIRLLELAVRVATDNERAALITGSTEQRQREMTRHRTELEDGLKILYYAMQKEQGYGLPTH